VPEGDSLHRAAAHLQPLVGETLAVEARHPRAQALGIAGRIDGKRLERVEAVGKNLLLSFEGGLVLRSHLGMRGRWAVRAGGTDPTGLPWLVLRGKERQAVLWNGSALRLARRHAAVERLGPDVMRDPPDFDAMVARLRETAQERELGDALLDQRLVAGIGNMWKAESLFLAGVSPWARLWDVSDDELRRVFSAAADAMRSPRRSRRLVYGRAGLPCRRCGTLVEAWRQGDAARTAYWCPTCQPGGRPVERSSRPRQAGTEAGNA
jgi:endonuclease-8